MIKKILFVVAIVGGSVFLATRAVNTIANYQQWVVDRAYDKGRAMERLCAKDPLAFASCEKHNAQTGHNIRNTPD